MWGNLHVWFRRKLEGAALNGFERTTSPKFICVKKVVPFTLKSNDL
jgi:hypothetical protein